MLPSGPSVGPMRNMDKKRKERERAELSWLCCVVWEEAHQASHTAVLLLVATLYDGRFPLAPAVMIAFRFLAIASTTPRSRFSTHRRRRRASLYQKPPPHHCRCRREGSPPAIFKSLLLRPTRFGGVFLIHKKEEATVCTRHNAHKKVASPYTAVDWTAAEHYSSQSMSQGDRRVRPRFFFSFLSSTTTYLRI